MAKNKKDNQNEGIGIVTIIVAVILAVLALYFFWGYHSERKIEGQTIVTVPTEAPMPVDIENPINNQNTEGSSINNGL